jgi:hypothetical protein
MSKKDKYEAAEALEAVAAKEAAEAVAAEAAAAKEKEEAEAAAAVASAAKADLDKAVDSALGTKGFFKTKLGYGFWHPEQKKMVGSSAEGAVELDVDGWVLQQLEAGYIEQITPPAAE